VELYLHSPS